MDSNGNQRKRGGRLNKNASANEPSSPTNDNQVTEVSAVAISPTLEEVKPLSNVPAASECRRSSRKKIIKFDVRDLLNKNRKTHKIQIEARIDSNAPSTSKASTNHGAEAVNSASSSTVREDMLSKQKTFLEKSAIFRRYSISQEHKPPPPLPIPPLLSKSSDNKETGLSTTSATRRLSRTQEFFSNAMIKPKQTTSLIIAQIESNTPSTATTTKRKNLNKSLETEVKSKQTEVFPAVQQKKRGRPARIKTSTPSEAPKEDATKTAKKLTPEKAKNWKEYKACLAQQQSQITQALQRDDKKDQKSKSSLHKEDIKTLVQSTAKTLYNKSISIDTGKLEEKEALSALEQHEIVDQVGQQSEILTYGDDTPQLTEQNTIEETKSNATKDIESEHVVEDDTKTKKGDISEVNLKNQLVNKNKSFEYSENDCKIDREKGLSEKQEFRNKNEVLATKDSKIEGQIESGNVKCTELKASCFAPKEIENTNFIYKKAISDIEEKCKEIEYVAQTKNKPENINQKESLKNISTLESGKDSTHSVCAKEIEFNYSLNTFSEPEKKEIKNHENLEAASSMELKNLTPTPIELSLQTATLETSTYHPSAQAKGTNKTFSRTSSSSESENASDRSSCSSAPSSASLSSPSSRSGSNLRVSVKRISLPKSPSTSSQTSTSEEIHTNAIRKKPPMAKRSKRLQNKNVGILTDQTACEKTDITTNIEKSEVNSLSLINTESVSPLSLDDSFGIDLKENLLSKDLQKEKFVEEETTKNSFSPVQSEHSTKNMEVIIRKAIKKPLTTVSKRPSRKCREINSESNDSESGKQETEDIDTEKQQINKNIQENFKTDDTTLKNQKNLEKSQQAEINENYEFEKSICGTNQTSPTGSTKIESPTEMKQQDEKLIKQSIIVEVEISNSNNAKELISLGDTSQDRAQKNLAYNVTVAEQLTQENLENPSDKKESSTTEDTNLHTLLEIEKAGSASENLIEETLESALLSKDYKKDVHDCDKKGTVESSTDISFASCNKLEMQETELINTSNILEKKSLSPVKMKTLQKERDKSACESDVQDDTATLAEPNSTTSLKDKTKFQQDQSVEESTKLLPKRRVRKSRFKNLHGPDIDSETDSNTDKQTPINEVSLVKPNDDNLSKDNAGKLIETTDTQEKILKQDIEKTWSKKEEKCTSDTEIIIYKPDENLNESEKTAIKAVEVENVNEDFATSSDLLSSQIQNVSIETNTLLDILRTVQSNTEAALKAIKPTTQSQISNEERKTESKNNTNQEMKIMQEQDEVSKSSEKVNTKSKSDNENDSNTKPKLDILQEQPLDHMKPSIENKNLDNTAQILQTTQEDKPLVDIKSVITEENSRNENLDNIAEELQKTEEDKCSRDKKAADLTSPTRCNVESPLTLKGIYFSPSRSESASPLNHKKPKQSPNRSASSSPLTLKKVTRRYERRSRRGDETAHKTLEETFAEIAAQSSKAVLAAKKIDIEETVIDKNLLNVEESQIIVTDALESRETLTNINEFAKELEEKSTNNEVENLQIGAKHLVDLNDGLDDNEIGQTDKKTKLIETKSSENILELQEISKTSPAKRGRKPKNRSQDVLALVSKETELKITPKDQKESLKAEQKLIETESDDKVKENTTEEVHSIVDIVCEVIEDSKVENKSIAEGEEDNKNSDNTFNFSKKETSNENVMETTACDSKSFKKCIKKHDNFKEVTEVVTEPLPAQDDNFKDNEEDVCSHKQLTKKRDSSQTKSETKSNSKKLTKKGKNNEEGATMPQKDDPIITPPTSKRGRKPKNLQETPPPTISTKKKTKRDASDESKEDDVEENQEKSSDLESDSKDVSLEKTLDEKLAKKKRQKKLKEAFEAALAENIEKAKDSLNSNSTPSSSLFGLTPFSKSPPQEGSCSSLKDLPIETTKYTCASPVMPEEDPDPLKDIEKFIADGVNLLKKDYKLDEDSVDDVITTTTDVSETLYEITTDAEIKPVINTFETPADTPINTPSVTPPPKSPTSVGSSTPDENSGVRRSHRIKLITKTPKALVGRGLVKDKERFSIKDDVETKIHYTMDDHLTGLAEVEAKNAKFLKEMEERLSNFHVIKENEYLCERVISREAKKMICDCFLTQEEEERGELGCGEDCLNRLLMIECGPDCNVKDRCTNKRFQKILCSPCRVFRTEKKGFGIMADIEILPGEFIMEYVGEVIDTEEFEKRRIMYSQDKNRHYYFMALRSDAIIDATIKGNISRFINHSCDPNAETQKWTVNGELRIGFFSRKSIMPGEEITFNYQYQRYGREAQRCFCESSNCRGWIGQEPTSDEGEQIDDDYESEDDEEEADTSNILVQDDEEDSDASVADPEEVQKQLEMAAAQAEVELAPLQLLDEKDKKEKFTSAEGKTTNDANKTENEEDSKSKFKKLLSKMAEKVAAKQKQTKREQKLQRKNKSKESSADLTNKLKFLEDPDIEDEVGFLKECGLKNQSDTLRLSRLMVRAKLVQTRLNLLEILRKGDFPCRRLFLDYHGLRLLHGWMSEDAGNMQIRLSLLQTLETLPIANKTVLTDSKVMQVVKNWCGSNTSISPNEDSSSSNSNSQDVPVQTCANLEEGSDVIELQKLALKLVTTWEGLPEIFRIPKKERIEQMKEHEREADRQYAANAETADSTAATDRYRRDRFGRGGLNTFNITSNNSNRFLKPNNGNSLRTTNTTPENIKKLSKAQRREMFAAKVARDEAEKRLAEERREFETKCRFFGLDPKKTRPQDVPFCVNPATGQWFSIERKPINTPPSYAHVQVPVKQKSTDPKDYQLPAVCSTLPPQWKYAITPQGKIYYYHIKHRISQWEPPSAAQLCENEDDDSESEFNTTAGENSSDDDEILIGMDAAQLKAYIDRKVEARRQRRYHRLVDERSISPRREEDRIYNQIEVRKYKENKEKIRKRKEEIRRRRAEALRQSSLNMCTLGSLTETNPPNTNKSQTESDEELGALPIQDYLLSSDEEDDIKAEVNSPLIDRIVEGDKIVDELDALTTKRQLKRPLPPHRDLSEPCTSQAPGLNPTIARLEYKKRKLEKKEKRKPKEQDAKYRKTKEKFRCEIAGIIVHYLKPYLKETCTVGRIQTNEDFNHLARKLTHFVMIKELKYCESVGQTLVVTESVKSKSREFIKKYMAKYGDVYNKPANDPEFKDIPFTL